MIKLYSKFRWGWVFIINSRTGHMPGAAARLRARAPTPPGAFQVSDCKVAPPHRHRQGTRTQSPIAESGQCWYEMKVDEACTNRSRDTWYPWSSGLFSRSRAPAPPSHAKTVSYRRKWTMLVRNEGCWRGLHWSLSWHLVPLKFRIVMSLSRTGTGKVDSGLAYETGAYESHDLVRSHEERRRLVEKPTQSRISPSIL